MAKFIRRTCRIQCAFCGKGLGSCIGGDIGENPSLMPGLLPQAAYNVAPITKTCVDGHEYPIMCSECEAKQAEKKDDLYTSFTPDFHAGWEMAKMMQEDNKDETSNSDNGTERA